MKPHTPLTWLASLLALAASSSPVTGQSVAAASNETVELSPFVVNSTKDTGYQAMNTLAGTHLNVPLRDLGAAISIYTRDFLDDIGATNMGELLIYAPNMDAAGPGGNYSSGNQLNDFNNTVVPQTESSVGAVRSSSQSTARARGLTGPTYTRNFFTSLVPIDTYNTERITVLRGPNAALFGTSSPSGVTDTSLARPDLQRNANKVSFRLDNNGGHRAIADFNRVLLPNKLALRLVGLQAREEFNQRPAYDFRERLYGALTYQPFRNTALRANFETGRGHANRPIPLLPSNAIANEWYNAGRPGFDWTIYDDPARNPAAASQTLNAALFPIYIRTALFSPFVVFYNNNDDRAPSFSMRSSVASTTTAAAAANAYIATLFHPLINRDSANDLITMTSTNNTFEMAPGAYWIGGNLLPGQLTGQTPPGHKPQGFLNFSPFDWQNRMIDESSRFMDSYHGGNVTLEQHAWDNRIGIELAYDQQRFDNRARSSFFSGNASGAAYIRIDTNVALPNGLPNPNLGRPYAYIQAAAPWNNAISENETRRATAYLKYDFNDLSTGWGKWLGTHTLSGVREIYQLKQTSFQFRHIADGPHARSFNPLMTTRGVSWVTYVGPSIIGNNNPLKLNPVKIPQFPVGPIGDIQYFERAANATDPGGFTSGPFTITHVNIGGSISREIIKAKALTLQSNWLDNHVATVLGWRRDADYFSGRSNAFVNNPANTNDPGKVIWGLDDINQPTLPPPTVAAESKSYSVVLNWPKKLIPLPRGLDFSVFYNDSENFTPIGGRIASWGDSLPPPAGKTREHGLNLFAFEGKLTIRYNRFETANKYATNNSNASGGVRNFPLDLATNWPREANVNPHLQAMRDADLARVVATLPPGYLQRYNVTVTGTPPNIASSRLVSITGESDMVDFTAKGEEIDIIYNPTPNWRILANIARQDTVRSNSSPISQQLLSRYKPVVDSLGSRAYGTYPVGWQVGDPLPANVLTVAQAFDQLVGLPLAIELASQGNASGEQRNWRWNVVTSYRFGSSPLFGERFRGWSIGGGLRWQDKMVMGYPSSRLPNTTPVFDRANAWYAPSAMNIDAFVSYGRKLWDNRIDWKVQFNATNIYQESDLIPIAAQPWGEPSAMRLAPERRFYLTNTFSF